jgi:glycosyltransferase involved in cell wall biosynthesis
MPRILIVSAFFTPSRRIGARRPERFARYLTHLGWDVTVLTLRPEYMQPLDEVETPGDGTTLIRTHAWMPGDFLRRGVTRLRGTAGTDNSTSAGQRQGDTGGNDAGASPESSASQGGGLARGLYHRLLARLDFPDRWIGWRSIALRAVRGQTFDVVLGTLPPYTSVLIAREIARRTGARLVMDYRDPWTEAPLIDTVQQRAPALQARHRALEESCLRGADLLLGTSHRLCDWLRQRSSKPVLFTPNSYEASPRTSDAVHSGPKPLVYTGSLVYGRRLDPLFIAMARLAPEFGPETLRFVYAGDEGADVLQLAEKYGISNRVEVLGSIPREATLSLVRDALLAVVVTSPRYEYNVPGKLSELLSARVPMMLIAPADSDTTFLFRRHNIGWHHLPEDIDGIARNIRKALQGERPQPVDVPSLQSEHVMAALDHALRQLIGAPHPDSCSGAGIRSAVSEPVVRQSTERSRRTRTDSA